MAKQQKRLPLGLILAGGQGRRMGGRDKALLRLGGASLLERACRRLAPQVAELAISANGDPQLYHRLAPDLPVLADLTPGGAGPLAGILAGLELAEARGFDFVVSVAVDTPFFPADLAQQLLRPGGLALAASKTGLHPTFGLWPVSLAGDLRHCLQTGGRKMRSFTESAGAAVVQFDGADPDPFFNINTPEDLNLAARFC